MDNRLLERLRLASNPDCWSAADEIERLQSAKRRALAIADDKRSQQEQEMRILAEEVTARDLKPGDLFSMAPQSYWDTVPRKGSVGERVYIRTETESEAADDSDMKVFRITIHKSEHKPSPDDRPPGWVTGKTP